MKQRFQKLTAWAVSAVMCASLLCTGVYAGGLSAGELQAAADLSVQASEANPETLPQEEPIIDSNAVSEAAAASPAVNGEDLLLSDDSSPGNVNQIPEEIEILGDETTAPEETVQDSGSEASRNEFSDIETFDSETSDGETSDSEFSGELFSDGAMTETDEFSDSESREFNPDTYRAASASQELPDSALPYSYYHAAMQTESITMSGVPYKDAIVFTMGYTGTSDGGTAIIDYNFRSKYSSMSFMAGYYTGAKRSASLTVIADGQTIIEGETVSHSSIAKPHTISLSGVSHLSIRFDSNGYDKARYAIGNILLTNSGLPSEEKTLESNMFYNCEPYYYRNASAVTEEFKMGGYTYADGINMEMGYTGQSDGGTSTVIFNFQGFYRSLSFDIAKYGATASTVRDAKITITADGTTIYDAFPLSWNDISRRFSIDLNGVSELKIVTVSDGYDKVNYRLGNIRMVSDGKVRDIVFKKEKLTVSSQIPAVQVEPVVVPNDAANQNYTLKIDSPFIADLDKNGLVTGRHKGTAVITATTEEGGFTAECTINSTLPQARFIPSRDGWGFPNQTVNIFESGLSVSDYYKDIYQKISGEYALYSLTNATGGIPSGPMRLYYTLAGTAASGGLCYGYAISSALTHTEDLPFSKWSKWGYPAPSKPGDVKVLSDYAGYSDSIGMYLKQFIFACFIVQGSKSFVVNEWLHMNRYEDLIFAVRNFQDTGKNPIVIKMNNGHAVLGYEVLEKDDETYVYIYDSNLDDNPDDNKIVFTKNASGEITGWSYSIWSDKKGPLSYIDSLSTVTDRLKKSEKLDFINNLIFSTSKKFSALRGAKTLVSYKDGVFSGNTSQTDLVPVSPVGGEELTGNAALAMLKEDNYTIQNDSPETKVTTVFANNDSAFIVDSDGKSKVIQTNENGRETIQVIPSTNNSVSIRYNYGEKDGIKISGESNGNVTAAPDNKGSLVVDGYQTLKVTVIRNGEETQGNDIKVLPDSKYTVSAEGKVDGKFPPPKPKKIPVKKISISGLSKNIAAGKKLQLTASVTPKNATNKAVSWKSSNTRIATVNSKGLVTIKKKTGGKSVKITATAKDGSGKKAAYAIKSMKGVVKSVKISGTKTVAAGKSLKLKAKVSATKGANKKLRWSSSNTKYAKVNASGKVNAAKAGKGKTVKITAMATDGSGKKATFKLKIK